MKKNMLLGFILIVCTNIAMAQKPVIHYGVLGGLNLSGINGDGMSNTLKPGFDLGVYANVPLSKNNKWSVEPELLGSFKQPNNAGYENFSQFFPNYPNPSASVSMHMNYISIPVLFHYKINKIIDLMAGPQYSYLLNTDENLFTDGKKAFKTSDAGIVAGIQASLGNVHFYGKYNYGLVDIDNIQGSSYPWYSRQIQIGVAVQIH